jgi:hypothetical protein
MCSPLVHVKLAKRKKFGHPNQRADPANSTAHLNVHKVGICLSSRLRKASKLLLITWMLEQVNQQVKPILRFESKRHIWIAARSEKRHTVLKITLALNCSTETCKAFSTHFLLPFDDLQNETCAECEKQLQRLV